MLLADVNMFMIGLIHIFFPISHITCPAVFSLPTNPDERGTAPDDDDINNFDIPEDIEPSRFLYMCKMTYTLLMFKNYYQDSVAHTFSSEEREGLGLEFRKPTNAEVFSALHAHYSMIMKVIAYKSCSVIKYNKGNESTVEKCSQLASYLAWFVSEIPIRKIYEMNPLGYENQESKLNVEKIVDSLERIRSKIVQFTNMPKTYFVKPILKHQNSTAHVAKGILAVPTETCSQIKEKEEEAKEKGNTTQNQEKNEEIGDIQGETRDKEKKENPGLPEKKQDDLQKNMIQMGQKEEKLAITHQRVWIKMMLYFGEDLVDLYKYFIDSYNYSDMLPEDEDDEKKKINPQEPSKENMSAGSKKIEDKPAPESKSPILDPLPRNEDAEKKSNNPQEPNTENMSVDSKKFKEIPNPESKTPITKPLIEESKEKKKEKDIIPEKRDKVKLTVDSEKPGKKPKLKAFRQISETENWLSLLVPDFDTMTGYTKLIKKIPKLKSKSKNKDMKDGTEIITYLLQYEMADSEFPTFNREWLNFQLMPVESGESDFVAIFS